METPLRRAERHIISLELTMTRQEDVIARMQNGGDGAGVALGRELLVTIRHCLALAVAHRNGLLRNSLGECEGWRCLSYRGLGTGGCVP